MLKEANESQVIATQSGLRPMWLENHSPSRISKKCVNFGYE